MKNLNYYVSIYNKQLRKGDILIAYHGLVKYVMNFRVDLIKKLSGEFTVTGMLHGYLDFTYFYFSNEFLNSKKLKFGLVLNHVEMRFEIWLLANTLSVRKQYWEFTKSSIWNKERTEMPKYAILQDVLVVSPDFDDLNLLSKELESKLLCSSKAILDYLKTL